eukprot:5453043-Amphidinium_carterae.1
MARGLLNVEVNWALCGLRTRAMRIQWLALVFQHMVLCKTQFLASVNFADVQSVAVPTGAPRGGQGQTRERRTQQDHSCIKI